MAGPVDSFEKDAAPPPATKVDEVEVVLRVRSGSPNTYQSRYSFDRLAADGSVVNVRSGELLSKMSANQRSSLETLLDGVLTKAKASI